MTTHSLRKDINENVDKTEKRRTGPILNLIKVMTRHRQASPSCPFVQNQSDNVPIVPGESRTSGPDESVEDGRTEDGRTERVRSEEETDDVGLDVSRISGRHLILTHFFLNT